MNEMTLLSTHRIRNSRGRRPSKLALFETGRAELGSNTRFLIFQAGSLVYREEKWVLYQEIGQCILILKKDVTHNLKQVDSNLIPLICCSMRAKLHADSH